MIFLTFEDDWAAVYDDDGLRLYQGHTSDVREWLVDHVPGLVRRDATPEQEHQAMMTGHAPERLS